MSRTIDNNPVDSSNTSPVDNTKTNNPVDNPDDVVKYTSYKKVLDEKKQLSSKHSEALAELAEYRAKEKALEEQKLIDEKKFSEAYQLKEQELLQIKSKADELEKEKLDFKKLHSFLSGLGDAKLEQKYFSLIPIDEIKIDDEGVLDQESINNTVNKFKADHQRLLITSKNDLPHNRVGGSGKGLSLAEWRNLGSSQEMKERYKEINWDA